MIIFVFGWFEGISHRLMHSVLLLNFGFFGFIRMLISNGGSLQCLFAGAFLQHIYFLGFASAFAI